VKKITFFTSTRGKEGKFEAGTTQRQPWPAGKSEPVKTVSRRNVSTLLRCGKVFFMCVCVCVFFSFFSSVRCVFGLPFLCLIFPGCCCFGVAAQSDRSGGLCASVGCSGFNFNVFVHRSGNIINAETLPGKLSEAPAAGRRRAGLRF